MRLLAAMLAKDAVGSSWRKTVKSREWCRVSLDEKRFMQAAIQSRKHGLVKQVASSHMLWVQPVRLLAAVLAKNAVGSSWRKTVDSRECSRVSLDEKCFVQAIVHVDSHSVLDLWLANTCLCTQPVRLLAAVLAKNAVGSSWRKTVDSREWSRVSLDHKRFVQAVIHVDSHPCSGWMCN